MDQPATIVSPLHALVLDARFSKPKPCFGLASLPCASYKSCVDRHSWRHVANDAIHADDSEEGGPLPAATAGAGSLVRAAFRARQVFY